MQSAYKYFENKYKDSKKMYTSIKKERDLFSLNEIGKSNIHKNISLSISQDQVAMRMIIDKYDLYKEENSLFLSKIERNDMYNFFHFVLGEYEDDKDFLPMILNHEAKYLNVKPSILAANLIQDRERLFFMKLLNQYDLPVEKFAEEMQFLDNNNILPAFQFLSDWFASIGVVENKEKFLVIILALSKILYSYEIKSKVVMDMSYKNDLSNKLLMLYGSPELLDYSTLTENEHIEVLKKIHILSFFAAQLTY